MDWMKQWIEEILAEVPSSRYRQRTSAELRDHLETAYRALLENGRTEDEARAGVLSAMGEPEKLRAAYKTAWQRTREARAKRAGVIVGGCFIMGIAYIMTYALLACFGFTYDSVGFRLVDGGTPLFIFSAAMFVLPFTLGSLFLRAAFREEQHPVVPVTAGLLAAWAGEKAAIILISKLIYGMPLGLDLLDRIYNGGDTTAPWFTPGYIVATFAGCILLGQLFGRFPVKRREKKAAS